MVTQTVERIAEEHDNRYRQGLVHLQNGEWQEAIACFEELQQEQTTDGQIDRLLEEARFKAELDAEASFRPRRWAIRWRPILAWTLVVIAVAAITVQTTRFISNQLLPGAKAAREARQRARLLEQGQVLLERGEFDEAEPYFLAVQQESPGHPEAEQALDQIAEMRSLADLYQQGVSFQEEGDDASALEALREVERRSPGYRDAAERIEQMEGQEQLTTLFTEANLAYESGDTLDALAAYERVRQINVSYQRDLVEARLFELYLEAGQTIIESPRVEDLPQAQEYFVRALALQPSSQEATTEDQLAAVCAEGLKAYDEREWGRAIGRLGQVIDERPGYLGGELVEVLYLSYVRLGEEYEKAGNLQLAYDQYQKARELPVDDALVTRRLDILVPRLTPTPTPTPMPTMTPEPTPRPFQGSTVQRDENLLENPSFEGGWYDILTGQVPDGWRFFWLDGVSFPDATDIALAPETNVLPRIRVPPAEQSLLFQDGSQNVKVFKSYAPMYGALVQDVSGLTVGRRYRLIAPIFVDTYRWEDRKVAPGGDAARVRLGAAPQGAPWRDENAITYSPWWDGTNTSDFYLQYSDFVFDFEATEPQMTIYIELAAIFGLSNNGFFIDNLALYPLGTRTGP